MGVGFRKCAVGCVCGAGADEIKCCGVRCGAEFFFQRIVMCGAVRNKKILRNVDH